MLKKKSKKTIFLIFKSNHRYSALGNFGKSKIYGNISLISLGGRFKSIIGKTNPTFGTTTMNCN